MEKTQIIELIGKSADEVIDWTEAQTDLKFSSGPEGKWDTSQHIDHLVLTFRTLNSIFKYPKIALRWKFGKPNRDGRNYDQVVNKYREKLETYRDKIPSSFAGKKVDVQKKAELLSSFKKEADRLQKQLNRWSDKSLDTYLVPHPLMGKMTVREMMMWASYHNYHHLDNLKENYV